jgi:DNA polymerase-1
MGNLKRTLLIDGDILLFKFGFRHQTEIEWANGAETTILDMDRAVLDLEEFIESLLQQTQCVDYLVCFTNKINFRYSVLPSYKHNRVDLEPPKMIKMIKDYLRENHPWKTQEYLEADDLMGIMGTSDPDRYVLATIDKDFMSLPVWLFNWNKDKKPRRISELEADYWFHYQWLKGDTGDGYHGCWRVGDKTARKVLEGADPAEWSTCVVATYATNKWVDYTWDDIITQARMARILRASDWDHERRRPILWTPDC